MTIIDVHSHTVPKIYSDIADPFRFTLGGPLRLSASSIDEYRGTDNCLVSAGYLRKIFPLPSGIGQGVYASFGYEAGETWRPQLPTLLRQNILGAVVAVTPLGAVSLGHRLGMLVGARSL